MSSTSPSVGVILCSSRQPRVCPQIGAYVVETIQSHLNNNNNNNNDPLIPTNTNTPTTSQPPPPSPQPNLHLIDLLTWNLPFFNEPGIPSQITHHTHYTHAHTRAWSLEVQSHAAFVFVTPQYNWGYPAVIKNAIDYLFHEWRGKPALIVSYGGHGGGKAAEQLRQVLLGVGMRVAETMPALKFPSREVVGMALRGEQVLGQGREGEEEGEGRIWEGEREVVWKGFEEVMALLDRKVG